ncbi:MAG: hypothetical protein NZ781_08525 [Armatimonadetes bacterium]|nr:hypothetical protein [Armatimonadota bacterium]
MKVSVSGEPHEEREGEAPAEPSKNLICGSSGDSPSQNRRWEGEAPAEPRNCGSPGGSPSPKSPLEG